MNATTNASMTSDNFTTDTINGTTTDGATPAPQSVHDFIDQTVHQNPVVLFMKGTAQFPQCGFSGRAIQLLKANGVTSLVTVNVLEDDEVRQGVKAYSNWPTVPQLYIGGEFVGGSDIIGEMHDSGELKKMLATAA